MRAAKTGVVAEFEIGYLQREIRVLATVSGGTDKGLRDASKTGFGVGRLVHVEGTGDSDRAITAATGVDYDTHNLGNATHIIAQSDDSIRELPEDYNYAEQYSSLPNLICKNSTEPKTVALWKIVNVDDVKLVNLG